MKEYLVRTADTHEWPAVHRDQAQRVLSPDGFDCAWVDRPGDVRLRCRATEVAFSGEDAGWQVSFEGDMADEDTDRFVAAVTRQVERAVGEPCEWLRIT